MKKLIFRIFSISLVSVLIFLSGLVTLIFYPQQLFAHKYDHGKFHIYYDSEIDQENAAIILDKAFEMIQKSELFDAERSYDVFLAYGNFINNLEDLQGKGPYARATAGNIFIKMPTKLDQEQFPLGRNQVNLSELLAHELIHYLQAHKYGLWNFSPLKHPPFWKVEGYAEYISREAIRNQADYDLKQEVSKLQKGMKNTTNGVVQITENYYAPVVYYKGRLMTEYLMDVEGLTFNQIMSDKRTDEEIFSGLCDWAK